MIIDVKPLSINQAYRGRRFKTAEYIAYEEEILYKLKPMTIPVGRLSIYLLFAVSNTNFDWDNPIKAFVDILQKKHKFNDNRIYRGIVDKIIVPKGKEYIYFELTSLKETKT